MSGRFLLDEGREPAQRNVGLLINGNFSDFKIECQGQIFKVHRAILTSRSPRLDAVIDGRFQESVDGCVSFPEDDKVGVAILLFYIYTGRYPWNKSSPDWSSSIHASFMAFVPSAADLLAAPLTLHANIIGVADKFMLPGLGEQAIAGFRHELHYRAPALISDGEGLRSVMEMISKIPDPEGQLDLLFAFVAYTIIHRPGKEHQHINAFAEVAEAVPKLGSSLVRELMYEQTDQHWVCESCGLDNNSKKPYMLVMASVKDQPTAHDVFEFFPCNCRFRGFCRPDEQCRYNEGDSDMVGCMDRFDGLLYCDECAETGYEDWEYVCGVQRCLFGGFKRIAGIQEPVQCRSTHVSGRVVLRL